MGRPTHLLRESSVPGTRAKRPYPPRTFGSRTHANRDGCMAVADDEDTLKIGRHSLVPPYDAVWQAEWKAPRDDVRQVAFSDDDLFHVELHDGVVKLVARSLADGSVRWRVPFSHNLSIEPAFVAGDWVIVPYYPIKGSYKERYEVRDLKTGKLQRTLPP